MSNRRAFFENLLGAIAMGFVARLGRKWWRRTYR